MNQNFFKFPRILRGRLDSFSIAYYLCSFSPFDCVDRLGLRSLRSRNAECMREVFTWAWHLHCGAPWLTTSQAWNSFIKRLSFIETSVRLGVGTIFVDVALALAFLQTHQDFLVFKYLLLKQTNLFLFDYVWRSLHHCCVDAWLLIQIYVDGSLTVTAILDLLLLVAIRFVAFRRLWPREASSPSLLAWRTRLKPSAHNFVSMLQIRLRLLIHCLWSRVLWLFTS